MLSTVTGFRFYSPPSHTTQVMMGPIRLNFVREIANPEMVLGVKISFDKVDVVLALRLVFVVGFETAGLDEAVGDWSNSGSIDRSKYHKCEGGGLLMAY